MKNFKSFYSSGEMAKMNGINKRTLHYYNDINLFCPDRISDNGFHYYSSFQCSKLEMILMLRKIGMPIEEIKQYIEHPSEEAFGKMVEEKKKVIDKTINELTSAKKFLDRKAKKLGMIKNLDIDKIELIKLEKRKLLYSDPITGLYDDADFIVASAFSQRLKNIFGLYDNFGSRIKSENILNGDYNSYSSFFSYCDFETKEYDGIMASGLYIRAYSIGGWDKLHLTYSKIKDFALSNHLQLVGDCYEEGLNEMMMQNEDDYITMISVGCKEIN